MIKSHNGDEWSEKAKQGKLYNLFLQASPHDKSLKDINKRLYGKESYFQQYIVHDADVFPTIRASRGFEAFRYEDKSKTTIEDVIYAQTFPIDYDFIVRTRANVSYVCGMSVPPVMLKRVVERLIESGIFREKES